MSEDKMEGTVPLTDAIIQEIVEKGLAKEEALVEAKAFGARYHPVRNSLIFPFDPGDDAGDDDDDEVEEEA